VFNRDMVLPLKFNADWAYITQKRQKQIVIDNQRVNSKRIAHEYHIGDKVLYSKHVLLKKLDTPQRGPFEVTKVYTKWYSPTQVRGGIRKSEYTTPHPLS
jgi:hypothetical protein